MAAHWYWTAPCVTLGCKGVQVLAYIGNDIDWPHGPEGVSIAVPSPFLLTCPMCGLAHDYSLDDIKPLKWTAPPPQNFKNRL
jgi:hypothetical protein